ncbi:MAG: hypothetical protein WBO68_04495 [Pyrinomonadaceae bacterium]
MKVKLPTLDKARFAANWYQPNKYRTGIAAKTRLPIQRQRNRTGPTAVTDKKAGVVTIRLFLHFRLRGGYG